MNTRNNVVFSSAELVYIGDIGFMFEIRQSLKHNLISPDVLRFFDGVQESGEVTEDRAFPHSITNTNLSHSIFHNIGEEWIVCHDGVFRKCKSVKCKTELSNKSCEQIFYVDKSLCFQQVAGVMSYEHL